MPCFPEFLPVITPVQATGLSGGKTESQPAGRPLLAQPSQVRQVTILKQGLQEIPCRTIQAKHEHLH